MELPVILDQIAINDISSSNTASTSTTVFVPPASNIKIENNEIKTELASENIDKGKSILGAPPALEKKDVKNPRAKKTNSQKPKQKKQHLCHHYRATSLTRPNCYKWLATQQSNDMIASRNQNQLQSSLAPLRDLLKALMFLSNLNGFPPHRRFKSLIKGKVLLGCGRKRASIDSITFLFYSLSSCFCVCITYVFCFQVLSQSSFYALVV